MTTTIDKRCPKCGDAFGGDNDIMGQCPKCGQDLFEGGKTEEACLNKDGGVGRGAIGSATISSKKYHFSYYYSKFPVCSNCGEYISHGDSCPACGNNEIETVIAEHYRYSNPRRCKNCSYESYSFSICPKCGSEMNYFLPYIIGDFTSLGEHYPDVSDCSEDEELLDVSETHLLFNAFSCITRKIDVTCNYYDWYVKEHPIWLKVTEGKDGDQCFLNLTITPNIDKQNRTGIILIKCGEKEIKIYVSQFGRSIRQLKSMSDLLIYLKYLIKWSK